MPNLHPISPILIPKNIQIAQNKYNAKIKAKYYSCMTHPAPGKGIQVSSSRSCTIKG